MACRVLGVNESTLRGWADSGLVRVFRTPGGHRRFLRDDLETALQRQPEHRSPSAAPPQTVGEGALRRIRRLLQSEGAEHLSWQDQLDEAARGRMRLFGRRLLELAATALERRRPSPQVSQEVRIIGESYGEELARLGLSYRDLMEAFLFFRTPLTEAMRATVKHADTPDELVAQVWQQVETLADGLLLAMTDAYERSVHGDKARA